MRPLVENAQRILEAAEALADADMAPSGLAILIGAEGSIRMAPAEGWNLDSMRRHYGASMAYRVSRSVRGVRVEGNSAGCSCSLEGEAPAVVARRLLAGPPRAACPPLLAPA